MGMEAVESSYNLCLCLCLRCPQTFLSVMQNIIDGMLPCISFSTQFQYAHIGQNNKKQKIDLGQKAFVMNSQYSQKRLIFQHSIIMTYCVYMLFYLICLGHFYNDRTIKKRNITVWQIERDIQSYKNAPSIHRANRTFMLLVTKAHLTANR